MNCGILKNCRYGTVACGDATSEPLNVGRRGGRKRKSAAL